jgi:L-cysteine:1D-myo-inositol 2-amino-2-deoxy-alpha-D-glucopyranoside ligase
MYVCGITPYDATHLGHANTYLAFDLVNRVWRDMGRTVHYVQNATDVDDPLLERARETGQDWRELADREIELFREDMTALRILPPDLYIGAVEAIPLIVEMVEKLRAKDATYEVDGDIYFPVAADPSFGGVSRLTRRQEGPPGRDGVDGPAFRGARLGVPVRPGPPRLARRMLGDLQRVPGDGLRRRGRRLGPGVPAPRDERVPRPGRHR